MPVSLASMRQTAHCVVTMQIGPEQAAPYLTTLGLSTMVRFALLLPMCSCSHYAFPCMLAAVA